MDKVTLGVRCKAILDDEAFVFIADRLRQQYINVAMTGTDEEALEARRQFQALERLRLDFANAVTIGAETAKKRGNGTA